MFSLSILFSQDIGQDSLKRLVKLPINRAALDLPRDPINVRNVQSIDPVKQEPGKIAKKQGWAGSPTRPNKSQKYAGMAVPRVWRAALTRWQQFLWTTKLARN